MIRQYIFELAAVAAVLAVLVSALSTWGVLGGSAQRPFDVWLIASHVVMLMFIGWLYFAMRTETRRRQIAEVKRLEADERLALMLRGSAYGIMLTDANGRIQLANPALEAMFGLAEHELEGVTINSLFETNVIDEPLAQRFDGDHGDTLVRTVTAKGNGKQPSAFSSWSMPATTRSISPTCR